MCVAGGRRCPGSGTPSAKQRAKRKANTAYRKAVAEAVGELTGNEELAQRVKSAPLTDVADVITAAGLDGEAIAKKCGQATYTDKDGHTTTVDVQPAGTTRRTPVTDDTKALLADVYAETGLYEPGPFAEAVVAGDRAAQEQLREDVDEHVANRLDLLDEEDLSHLNQERLERRLDQLADLDNYSQKYAGRSLDPETEAKVAELAERYENALNGQGEPEPAPQRDPLADLNNTYGFGEVTEDNVEDVIAAANTDIENVELDTLTDAEFEEYYNKMDELDDRVRSVTGEEGIEGFAATLTDELEYRNEDDDDKYEFHDEYRRAAQLDKWAEATMDAGVSDGDSQSARGAYAAAQYLYQYDPRNSRVWIRTNATNTPTTRWNGQHRYSTIARAAVRSSAALPKPWCLSVNGTRLKTYNPLPCLTGNLKPTSLDSTTCAPAWRTERATRYLPPRTPKLTCPVCPQPSRRTRNAAPPRQPCAVSVTSTAIARSPQIMLRTLPTLPPRTLEALTSLTCRTKSLKSTTTA